MNKSKEVFVKPPIRISEYAERECFKCHDKLTEDKYTNSEWIKPENRTPTCSLCQKKERQTRTRKRKNPGSVYIIKNKAWDGWLKIGSSTNVINRLNTFNTASPLRDYELVGFINVPNVMVKFEIHDILKEKNYLFEKEWFQISEEDALAELRKYSTIMKIVEVNISEHSDESFLTEMTKRKLPSLSSLLEQLGADLEVSRKVGK